METAIVTGSSSGIGEAIARMLLEKNYRVIGLSRRHGALKHENFSHISCDFTDSADMEGLKTALAAIDDLVLLVNCAGFGRFEPHEELSPQIINAMISINLTAPITLTNLLLRQLKETQGKIINITSIEATRHSKFSALYTATKSGLRAFGHALFEEVRANGVGVVTINPDMTDTPFFDALRFGVGEKEDTRLLASDIAKMLSDILDARDGVSITELTIRPTRFGITKKR